MIIFVVMRLKLGCTKNIVLCEGLRFVEALGPQQNPALVISPKRTKYYLYWKTIRFDSFAARATIQRPNGQIRLVA